MACRDNRIEVVRFLLQKGVAIFIQDKSGSTPLAYLTSESAALFVELMRSRCISHINDTNDKIRRLPDLNLDARHSMALPAHAQAECLDQLVMACGQLCGTMTANVNEVKSLKLFIECIDQVHQVEEAAASICPQVGSQIREFLADRIISLLNVVKDFISATGGTSLRPLSRAQHMLRIELAHVMIRKSRKKVLSVSTIDTSNMMPVMMYEMIQHHVSALAESGDCLIKAVVGTDHLCTPIDQLAESVLVLESLVMSLFSWADTSTEWPDVMLINLATKSLLKATDSIASTEREYRRTRLCVLRLAECICDMEHDPSLRTTLKDAISSLSDAVDHDSICESVRELHELMLQCVKCNSTDRQTIARSCTSIVLAMLNEAEELLLPSHTSEREWSVNHDALLRKQTLVVMDTLRQVLSSRVRRIRTVVRDLQHDLRTIQCRINDGISDIENSQLELVLGRQKLQERMKGIEDNNIVTHASTLTSQLNTLESESKDLCVVERQSDDMMTADEQCTDMRTIVISIDSYTKLKDAITEALASNVSKETRINSWLSRWHEIKTKLVIWDQIRLEREIDRLSMMPKESATSGLIVEYYRLTADSDDMIKTMRAKMSLMPSRVPNIPLPNIYTSKCKEKIAKLSKRIAVYSRKSSEIIDGLSGRPPSPANSVPAIRDQIISEYSRMIKLKDYMSLFTSKMKQYERECTAACTMLTTERDSFMSRQSSFRYDTASVSNYSLIMTSASEDVNMTVLEDVGNAGSATEIEVEFGPFPVVGPTAPPPARPIIKKTPSPPPSSVPAAVRPKVNRKSPPSSAPSSYSDDVTVTFCVLILVFILCHLFNLL